MYIKSFDGTKIYYRIKRQSKLFLVFIHGWLNNWPVWKKQINAMQRQGYSTLTLDLRGHGKSGKPEEKEKYELENFAKDLYEIIKKEKIKDFVLIGHSMGGMISLLYYKMFKTKPKALILAGTTSKGVLSHYMIKKYKKNIKKTLDFLMEHEKIKNKEAKIKEPKNIPDLVIKSFIHTPKKVGLACLKSMIDYDAKDVLKKIKQPVLILEGEKDIFLPEVNAKEMFKKIKNAEIVIIPKATHWLNFEKPKTTTKYIQEFLQKNKLTP